MTLLKLTLISTFAFVFINGYSQLGGTPSYSSTSCNGKIWLQTPGAYPNYEWYTSDTVLLGNNLDTISNLCPGEYLCHFENGSWMWSNVTVFDRDSCRQWPNQRYWVYPTNTSTCDGSAEVYENTPYLNIEPYSFLWSTGDTVRTINNLCHGSYSVVVEDGYGCIDSLEYNLYPTCPGMTISESFGIPSGYYNCDGEFEVVVSGMTGPYTQFIEVSNVFDPSIIDTSFTLNSSSDTLSLENLCSGTYDIKIVDPGGCMVQTWLHMYDTLLYAGCGDFQIYANSSNVSSSSVCDGSLEVFASGNDGTMTYYWIDITTDTISNNSTLDSLCAGGYIVHAYDQNDCYSNYIITVGDSNSIQIDYTILNEASSPVACDGEITFQISGGTPPYTNVHSSGDSSVFIQQCLCPGIHFIYVWDSSNRYQGLNYLIVPQNQLYNGMAGGVPIDTLNATPTERCDIDYDDILNVYILNYTIIDSLITTEWVVNYSAGGQTIVYADYIANIDTTQVYAFSLSLFCSSLKAIEKRFKAYSDLSGNVLSITTNETLKVNIYPNPSNGEFTLYSDESGSYEIYSANGQVRQKGNIVKGSNTIQTQYKGVFMLRFITSKGLIIRQVIFQ